MARTNGKVTGTVKRLLALEEGQREVNKRLQGIDARLEVMTEHLERQGETLTAIRDLLVGGLPLRIADDPAELIRLFWQEGRIAFAMLSGRSPFRDDG